MSTNPFWLNLGKPYAEQIKPFNFLQTCNVAPLGHPQGVNPEKFHLVTPYDPDPRKWLEKDWIDQYTSKRFRVTTAGHYGGRNLARVKTYGEIAAEYEFHPESKLADADGSPCSKQTVGLLQRRHVKIDQINCIGKESNSLENLEEGLVHSEQNVYTEYSDPKRDEWTMRIQPALKALPLKLLVAECQGRICLRELIELRAGRSRPHRKIQELLAAVVRTEPHKQDPGRHASGFDLWFSQTTRREIESNRGYAGWLQPGHPHKSIPFRQKDEASLRGLPLLLRGAGCGR